MPELPEVETTRRGIEPHVSNRLVDRVLVREARLRWPVSPELADSLQGKRIHRVLRRGKYLLLSAGDGTVLIHLGMSGSLRVLPAATPAGKHDHVDVVFTDQTCLRFTDPRRFGCLLWLTGDVSQHRLLSHLGPEPLSTEFDGNYLWRQSRGRRAPVKNFVMDSRIVVGVGNIYANEALFMAGIHPKRDAGRISVSRYDRLAGAIQTVLTQALAMGGTTLRDFTNSQGNPGYFRQSLQVYGRRDLPCRRCGQPLREIRIAARSTVYCVNCQK